MTRKRRGLSMTSILVLALVGTITAIVLGAMAVFLQTYQRSLIRSVQTSARQSVAQVGKTVEDYLDDVNSLMELLERKLEDPRQDREQLDEVVELIAETLCSRKKTIVVAGDEYPAEMVKEKLLRITSSHIEYVFDCLKQNTTYVRNIKKYLLASLFNAPSTIGSYYSALVNHDMYGDGLRGR